MRWILHFRVFIIIGLAVTLISVAVLFSVLRAVLPYATGYKTEIQQEISKQIGLPVEIDSIDASIHWFSPRLKLLGVSVFDDKDKVPLFNFKEAFVELDVFESVLQGEIIIADVGLVGADISIEKLSDKEWLIQGIKFTSEGSDEVPAQFLYMLQNSNYLLHDSNIYYQDNTGEKLNISLLDINMDVDNSLNKHRIKLSMDLPKAYGKNIVVVAELKGDIDSLDGDVYIDAQRVKVKQWNETFNLQKRFTVDANLDINIWAKLKSNDVQSLLAELSSSDISIKNNTTGKSWETAHLSTKLRYEQKNKHWNFAVSDFYFGTKNKPDWPQPVNMLLSDDEDYYYLSADFLRVTDVQKMTDLILTDELLKDVDNIPGKVKSYQLQADIYNLDLQVPKDMSAKNLLDNLDVQATVVDFSVVDSANDIALSGVDATVKYKNQHADVELQSKAVSADMKQLFREPINADILQGNITLDNTDAGWHIQSDMLQLKNAHINSFSRLDLSISSNDEIFIDAQTDFYDAYGKNVTHYLPVGIMSPELVGWLDMAVTDGYIPGGSFILYGDPGNFPYKNKKGVFQVMFSVQDVNMKFLQNWPLLNGMSASLKFNDSSLIINGLKSKTQEIELYNGYAEILDLYDAHLTIKSDARATSENMQSYIWNSPLDEELGNTMRLFQLKGENRLNLALEVPLEDEVVDVSVKGRLQFINTELYYPDLGYEIAGINGSLDFTKQSIFAESINAKIDGKPVSINMLTEKGESGQQVVFHLDGVVAIDYLLQSYEWIPENWLSGSSDFSINLEVPYQPKDQLLRIDISSALEGVVINVSDKVQKPASSKVAFATQIDVLGNNNLRVNASLADVSPSKKTSASSKNKKFVDLFAVRNDDKAWSFNLKSRYLTGKGKLTEGLGKDTQFMLDLDEIDLYAMSVSAQKKDSNPLHPSDFPPLDWRVKKLLWDDWVFTDVILETDWHEHGMLINKFALKGPAMTFDARGTWLTLWNGSNETTLEGNTRSSNCGTTLVGLGYAKSLDRCTFKESFSATWPAEPFAMSWDKLKGKSSFKLKDGEILDVDPGAGGRLLGLLNVFKLTNRLAFNFDDVTRKGFSFDSIKGDFIFVDGEGSLKDVVVSASAADMSMFGSIGLVKHDYGLLVEVKPHTDTLTFAGGALLGGVVIGAGLAIVQKVFDINLIGNDVYSITGSWENPKIEKIVEKTSANADDDDF
jgi:uncharacterized protein YhdP